MWRNTSHKLILVFKRKKNANDYSDQDILTGELYDLKNDPEEWTDLFNDQDFQNTKKEMSTALLNHLKNMRID